MPRFVLAAAISAAFMLAAPALAQDLTPEGRGAYVAMAGAVDLYTVRSAEIALEKARRPEVRQFAQQMLDDHRQSTEELSEIARAVGLDGQLPPAMLPIHWEMLRDLEDASSSRFDGRYMDQQVDAHEMALELHQHFAQAGNGERLKAYAASVLPTVTQHLAEARRLEE